MSVQQERRRVKRTDCYSRTLSNDDIEHSLVVDINNEGAGLLLLKEQSLFQVDDEEDEDDPDISGKVHLTIFHPDMSLEQGISIDADVRWVKHDFSKDHHKIGVRFVEMNNAQVGMLAEWLSKEGNYYFHCELEKR
jgi:hypothetical protein